MRNTVIMAVYNGQQYLQEQLDSIRLQTQQPDEVIFGDDGSTDNSVRIIEEYIEKYGLKGKWKVIINEKNLGYANNFNSLLNLASGDYIFLADQDDIWELDKIQVMAHFLDITPDCELLCCDYEPYFMENVQGKAPSDVLARMNNNGLVEKNSWSANSAYLRTLGCCMCVRKSFIEEIIMYWYDNWAQDDRLWRLAQCKNGCYTIHKELIRHRIHGSNACTYQKYHTRKERLARFEEMQLANQKMLEYAERLNDLSKVSDIKQHIRIMNLRLELLAQHKFLNALKLIAYTRFYEKKKSYLADIYFSVIWMLHGE